MKPNHSNSDIYGDIDSWSLKEAPERLKVNSDNLKEQISEILNKVSLYASDWYDDDSDDGLTVKEATNQILELVASKVPEGKDASWKGKELCEPDKPIDIVTEAASIYGEKCLMDGHNACRQAMLDNLGIKEQLDERQ